jgi:uncharacterized protein (UPF0305 family)
MKKYLVIKENSRHYLHEGVEIEREGRYVTLRFENGWVDKFNVLFLREVKKLENIYMTPEEVSEKAKKYAKMEQRILDWLDVENDKYVIEKLKHLLNG